MTECSTGDSAYRRYLVRCRMFDLPMPIMIEQRAPVRCFRIWLQLRPRRPANLQSARPLPSREHPQSESRLDQPGTSDVRRCHQLCHRPDKKCVCSGPPRDAGSQSLKSPAAANAPKTSSCRRRSRSNVERCLAIGGSMSRRASKKGAALSSSFIPHTALARRTDYVMVLR